MRVQTGSVRHLALALLLGACAVLSFEGLAQDADTEASEDENTEQTADKAEEETSATTEPEGSEEPEALGGEYDHFPHHRFDGTWASLDSDIDSSFILLSYTYSIKQTVNLSVTLPLVDPDLGQSGTNYEPSDLGMSFSWVPFVEISANPWIPKSVGTGLFVLIPSGNAQTLDAWIVNPFLGLALPLSEHWFFTPQLGVVWGLDTTASGIDVEVLTLGAGLTYVSDTGFWVFGGVEFARDFWFDETAVNWELTVGKMFSTRFGLSANVLDFELQDPLTGVPLGGTGDVQLNINLHFTF